MKYEALQDDWELKYLLSFYRALNPKVVVEIGTLFGGTLIEWLKHGKELQKVISIDLPIAESDPRYKQYVSSRDSLRSEVATYMDLYSFREIHGDSTKPETTKAFIGALGNDLVDFLVIDGGHGKHTVRFDLGFYSTFVREGGLVVFHDTKFAPGVKTLWEFLKRKHKTIEINGQYGTGILFK